jgi:hypothetical protein
LRTFIFLLSDERTERNRSLIRYAA